MPALKERLTDGVQTARERWPVLDHLVRTVQHYGSVKGNLQAGAVTYFGFLSFFPILAIAFAIVGYVARVVPDAQQTLVDAIEEVLPRMVSTDGAGGTIAISDIQDAAPAILSIGLPVMLYSGLGWLSAMRDALLVVFEKPAKQQPSFVVGKLKDLAALATLGLVLMLSVAISGVVTSLAGPILELLGLGVGAEPAVWVLAIVLGLAASAVLFFAFFRVLADPQVPARSLWAGALLGAIGFEALKLLSRWLIASTAEQPAFQAFGIALILVVWINYFSRVVMYAASWAHTSPAAVALHAEQRLAAAREATLPEGPATGPAVVAGTRRADPDGTPQADEAPADRVARGAHPSPVSVRAGGRHAGTATPTWRRVAPVAGAAAAAGAVAWGLRHRDGP